MLFKFILINQSNFCGLLELQIIFINNTLIFEYSLYVIKNRAIIPMIEQSLYDNAESRTVVNSLGKELYKRGEMGLYKANEFSIACTNSFNTNSEYIQIGFQEFKIYVNHAQLRIIYNFVDMYCKSYDLILMKYQQQYSQQQQVVANTPEVAVINDQLPVDNTNLIHDIMLFSPNKQITNYLFRQTLTNKNSYCNITDEYVIEFTNFLNIYKISFSKTGFSTFVQLFSSINLSTDDCISNSKNIFQTLMYILKNNISNTSKLEIQLCLSLLFFYYCKIRNFDFDVYVNKKVIPSFLNFFTGNLQSCLDQLTTFNKLSRIVLKLKSDYGIASIDDNLGPDKVLESIVSKYQYLQILDRDAFIKKVWNETVLYRDTKAISDPQGKILTQTVLDLTLFIKKDTLVPMEPLSDLDYYLISERIISKPYFQLRKLIDDQMNSVLILKDIHPILNKYTDVLISTIIPNLNKNHELIEYNESVLILYKMFIVDHILPEHQMFILYQIILPYIFDVFNKTQFIDCFH